MSGLGLLRSQRLGVDQLSTETWLAATGASAHSGSRYAESIRLGKPGRCPERPILLIALYDNSASITGGNDPIGHRFLEAGLAIARVGARCRCGRDLVATLHVDTPTSGDLQPTSITKKYQQDISRSMAAPPDGAGISCLGPSLTAARRFVDRHPAHHPVLVVLSDFELFDDFLDQLIAFPGSVHAIVLRAQPPAKLEHAPSVTVTPVQYGSQPGTVARAVFAGLTTGRPGARPLPAVADVAGRGSEY
jgi:hypothetical protein